MHKFEMPLGREKLIIETGKLAKQADGAVTVQCGGTLVLVTAVSAGVREGIDFFPLTVEYQERTYAAGKIPGGFFKREGRPSQKEILTARLIDRPIRPLFPKGFFNEVQITALVLSSDCANDSDVLAVIGASAALSISGIAFGGPIAAVRVGIIDGKFVVNPTFKELESSDLDLVVAATREKIIMLESGSKELGEEKMVEAIRFGQEQCRAIIELQDQMKKACGKPAVSYEPRLTDPDLLKKVRDAARSKFAAINKASQKEEREEALATLLKELVEKFVTEDSGHTEKTVKAALAEVEEEEVRRFVVDEKKRVDGRAFNEIRKISCEVGVLPRTHGSGLFTRGQTQSLSVTTLGTSSDEQIIDALEGETTKHFMLHYNFPPFSVGEAKPMRGPGRREIGHGALAERALLSMMPSKDAFPYTVRIVSDTLESNGSSSMASVCAGTLSLMDAGVPIIRPVSGIAMGLITDGDKAVILTDIAGVEDHFGDMDFKVAGTREGITAIQLDLKIDGVTPDLLKDAFVMAKEARLSILEKMVNVISSPKGAISEFAPRIVSMKIPVEKIRDVIGSGGKVIRKIIQDTGCTIDVQDDGSVQVASSEPAMLEKAVEIIKSLTCDAEVGKVYTGKIKRIMNFGAFCEIMPGREGLIHVSELDVKFVKNVEDVVKVGDEVTVKCIEIDDQGRVNLSRKALLPGAPETVPGAEGEGVRSRDQGRGRDRGRR